MFTVLKSKEMQGNAFRSICVKTELYSSWRGWFGGDGRGGQIPPIKSEIGKKCPCISQF